MQYFTRLSSNKILTSVMWLFQQKQKVLGDYNNSQPTVSLVFKRHIRHGKKQKESLPEIDNAYLKEK